MTAGIKEVSDMKMILKSGLLAAALTSAMAFGGAAQATVILFSNFDSVVSPAPTTRSTRTVRFADGWTATSPLGIELQFNNAAGQPFSGIALVELDTTANSGMFLNLARGHYQVSYHYSPRPNQSTATNGITLLDGTRLLDSVTGQGGGATVWQKRTVDFFTLGGPLSFNAVGTSNRLGGYLDDITVSSVAVPEPASWAMLIGGFGLIGIASRRQRRAGNGQMARVLS
jgi:hypothetical protein